MGLHKNMQIDGVCLGRFWVRIRMTSTFDLQLLGLWVVINVIVRGGRGLAPLSLGAKAEGEEHLQRWCANA